MGYKWLHRRNRHHRMVNHHARSKDKRYQWARDRWCKNGVHCQAAEGGHAALKRAMKMYTYVRPQYSQLYLDEYAFVRGLKYYGFEKLMRTKTRSSVPPLSVKKVPKKLASARLR